MADDNQKPLVQRGFLLTETAALRLLTFVKIGRADFFVQTNLQNDTCFIKWMRFGKNLSLDDEKAGQHAALNPSSKPLGLPQ